MVFGFGWAFRNAKGERTSLPPPANSERDFSLVLVLVSINLLNQLMITEYTYM